MSRSHQTPSILFMKLWREFDCDGNGFLDREESGRLVRQILAKQQHKLEDSYGIEKRDFTIQEEELQCFVQKLVIKFNCKNKSMLCSNDV